DLIRQNDIPCDARQNGWIRAEHCPRATHVAQKNASLWNAFGADLQVISAQDVQRLSGAQGYRSGILAPKGGAVQPLALTRGLARACLSHGARLFDHSPATNVMRQNGRWRVQVGARTLTADQVILATNGYTDGLWPGLKRSILALHSIQIATDPLPAAQLDPILPQGHTISDTRRLIMYARREPGHQIVFGGIGFCIRRLGRFGFNWLLKDAPRIFPSLRGVTWRYRWGGQIALTPGRVPHLHEPAPGVLAGLGYNGRGVAMSFLMGQQLALRALGTAATDLVFPMTNITPYVGAGFQSAGAGLAMATFRLRDVLDIGGWTGQSLGRDGNS
ncbi:MAG: FAD-dependent oxidoreductase, partial [Pseudomonadota bacterium]